MNAALRITPYSLVLVKRDDTMPPTDKQDKQPTDKIDELLTEVRAVRRMAEEAPKAATAEQYETLNDNVMALGASINKLDQEVRSNDKFTRNAISGLDDRITKVERRSVAVSSAPVRRMSPMPGRYATFEGESQKPDALAPIEKRLVEVEANHNALAEELSIVLAERDAAKVAEQKAQERQAAITEYAAKKEKEALAEKEKAEEAKQKAKNDKETAEKETEKKLKRYLLVVKILGGVLALGVTLEGIFRLVRP